MEARSLNAFADELVKIAWGGRYYHGTSPSAEKSILSEGFKASRGGETMRDLSRSYLLSGNLKGSDLASKFVKDTEGRVTLSRSKLLAKTYGISKTEQETGAIAQAAHRAAEPFYWRAGDSKPARMAKHLARPVAKGVAVAKEIAKQLVSHQPLQVEGRGLKLTRDSGHKLLGVQHLGDIPASLVRKANPSRLGRLIAKVL